MYGILAETGWTVEPPFARIPHRNGELIVPAPRIVRRWDNGAVLLDCDALRGTVYGDAGAVLRLALPLLWHRSLERGVPFSLSPDGWEVLSWEDRLARLITQVMKQGKFMPVKTLQQKLTTAVRELLQHQEVVKTELAIEYRSQCLLMGYPGKDIGQPNNPTCSGPQLQKTRQAFWKKAVELGYNILATSKSAPCRKVMRADVAERLDTQLGLFHSLATQKRALREQFSLVVNAQELVEPSDEFLVTVGDVPDVIRRYVKSVNAAIMPTKYAVGDGVDVGQIVGTAWTRLSTKSISYREVNPGNKEMDQLVAENGGAEVRIISRPLADGEERIAIVQEETLHHDDGVYKIVTPDGVKGMVLPTRAKIVEKRDGENFYRPIELVFAPETVASKDAYRMVRRMQISHLGRCHLKADLSKQEVDELAEAGKDGAGIFLIEAGDKDIPMADGEKVHGTLKHLGRFVTGEVLIARVQEDELHGAPVHDIVIDPFINRHRLDILPTDDDIERINDLLFLLGTARTQTAQAEEEF